MLKKAQQVQGKDNWKKQQKKVQACWNRHGNYQNLFTEESFLIIVMNIAQLCL